MLCSSSRNEKFVFHGSRLIVTIINKIARHRPSIYYTPITFFIGIIFKLFREYCNRQEMGNVSKIFIYKSRLV